MTITHGDGRSVQAILLSRDENTLCAVVRGEEDTLTFRAVNGTWISEGCDPVTIEFEWQRRKQQPVPAEADCLCSKQLAAKLIERLYSPEHDEPQEQLLHIFTPDGLRVGVSFGELVN